MKKEKKEKKFWKIKVILNNVLLIMIYKQKKKRIKNRRVRQLSKIDPSLSF